MERSWNILLGRISAGGLCFMDYVNNEYTIWKKSPNILKEENNQKNIKI